MERRSFHLNVMLLRNNIKKTIEKTVFQKEWESLDPFYKASNSRPSEFWSHAIIALQPSYPNLQQTFEE